MTELSGIQLQIRLLGMEDNNLREQATPCSHTEKLSENSVKTDLVIKDIDKLRESLHQIEIDLSTMCQKFEDSQNDAHGKIDEITKLLDDVKEEMIKRKSFLEASKSIFINNPFIMQSIMIVLIVLISPDVLKDNVVRLLQAALHG